jgi:hypothetical protein
MGNRVAGAGAAEIWLDIAEIVGKAQVLDPAGAHRLHEGLPKLADVFRQALHAVVDFKRRLGGFFSLRLWSDRLRLRRVPAMDKQGWHK